MKAITAADEYNLGKGTNKTTSHPLPPPTLLEHQISKWLDTPTTVWLCLRCLLGSDSLTAIGEGGLEGGGDQHSSLGHQVKWVLIRKNVWLLNAPLSPLNIT